MPHEDDLYSDAVPSAGEPSEAMAPEMSEAPAPEEESAEEVEPERGLLPKSLFPGDCKPGDKFAGEVVAVHDNEVEVKVNKDYGQAEPSFGEVSEGSDAEMGRMME